MLTCVNLVFVNEVSDFDIQENFASVTCEISPADYVWVVSHDRDDKYRMDYSCSE